MTQSAPASACATKRAHQRIQPGDGHVALVAHPHAEIHRDLIVARARRVQAPGGRADHVAQPRFDIHVDIFQRGGERELPRLDLCQNLRQTRVDACGVFFGQDAGRGQHRGMGARACDILRAKPLVIPDGGVDRLHDRVRPGGKAPAPHGIGRLSGHARGPFPIVSQRLGYSQGESRWQ